MYLEYRRYDMDKIRILFIIPWLPYPLKSGGHMALFNGIASIKDDYDIYIAFKVDDDKKYIEDVKGFIKQYPHIHLFPLLRKQRVAVSNSEFPLWYRLASHIKTVVRNIVYRHNTKDTVGRSEDKVLCSSWIYSISPMDQLWLEHISQICSKHHFDIIQVEMPWLISQILTLPQDAKRIFVHHELGFVRRSLEIEPYDNNEYVKACKSFTDMAEISMLNMYDGVITLSAIDKEKLMAHGVTVPVFDSFSVVNTPQEVYRGIIDGRHLTFVGPDSHSPNFIGITWFLDNCWPLLLSKDDNYRLSIIGEWSKEHIEEYSQKYTNIEFLGFVDCLANSLKGTVMIVPITIGSGIRMKILEASSIGVPFVSTTVGSEGIPVVDGENCYLADTPEMFADKIRCLQDERIQSKFVNNAHTMIMKYYSKEALRKNRLEIYMRILENTESF